jgi:hypothetical protein
MQIERTSGAVITVRFNNVRSDWERWILLRSDAHHDSPMCRRKAEKRHLDEMVKRDGLWMDFGDLFDAMQGKFDPRRDYSGIRKEDAETNYYDLIVEHATDFYSPYADRCLVLALGGHETATERNCGLNLTSNLAFRLHAGPLANSDHRIEVGGFGGWVRFMFQIHKTVCRQLKLKWFHGAGGRAPVTKGVIQTNRQAVYLPDANIVINGHNHQSYIIPMVRERINQRGYLSKDIQWHGRIPGYKDDYGDGSGGWAVEKGFEPTPVGALWLRLWYEKDAVMHKLIPQIE